MATEVTIERMPDPATTGVLRLDESGYPLGPATTLSELDAARPFGPGSRRRYGDETYVTLSSQPLNGQVFKITLVFDPDRLAAIDLFLPMAGEGASWADWSLDGERARRAAAEAWAERVFGQVFAIKPYVDPETGRQIMPFDPDREHPKHLRFGWGEVISYYDSKGGMSGMRVRYITP